MMRRTLALVLTFALTLALPLATASGDFPPTDATRVDVGGRVLVHWVGGPPLPSEPTERAEDRVQVNESATLHFGLAHTNATGNMTAYVNVSSDALRISERLVIRAVPVMSSSWDFASVSFRATNATENATYSFTVDLHEEQANGTVLVGTATGTGTLLVEGAEAPVPAPAPGVPSWVWLGLAVGVLGVLVGGILIGRQRAQRRAMQGQKRSQVMRELELEQKLEKAKDPEQVQEIKQEIRQQEQVREKRRELQILEAKRADVMKTLDLLKKRHESGGLTKLQYDNMVAKKQGDLQKIEADIAQMEAEDAGGAAAS